MERNAELDIMFHWRNRRRYAAGRTFDSSRQESSDFNRTSLNLF